MEEMHAFQLDHTIIRKLLRAKETNQKPIDAYTKSLGVDSGHLGQDKILGYLKEQFYWLDHFRDVHSWCESCISCTTRKTPAPG